MSHDIHSSSCRSEFARASARRAWLGFCAIAITALVPALTCAAAPRETGKLLANGSLSGIAFGTEVATSGDLAVVGQTTAAYVFARNAAGQWSQTARIAPDDGTLLVKSIAIDGDTLLIGTSNEGDGLVTTGTVYVYERGGKGEWNMRERLAAGKDKQGDGFGAAVAIAGATAIIGAPDETVQGGARGAAYVFVRDDEDHWTRQAILHANNGGAGDRFGGSVSIAGDVTVVGAKNYHGVGDNSGAAYVFARDASGHWGPPTRLRPADAKAFTWFGSTVAIDGDTVVVGEPFDSVAAERSGSAYVFVRGRNGGWRQQARLAAADGAVQDYFGVAVGIAGNSVVVGADYDDAKGDDSGAAYVFTRDAAGHWKQQDKLFASDGRAGDKFGACVAFDGRYAVIGAPLADSAGPLAGAAYVYVLGDERKRSATAPRAPGVSRADTATAPAPG